MIGAKTSPPPPDFKGLPGAALIEHGIADGKKGTTSVEALLVAIAAPRLRRLGIDVPPSLCHVRDGELQLYREICRQRIPDPYSHYNALLRQLVSFEHALERRLSRAR